MSADIHCWKCGKALTPPLPLGRRESCPACLADLHSCRQCQWYDPKAANSCREPSIEPVKEKEQANFCDDFRLLTNPGKPGDQPAQDAARKKLETLFGKF
ncbi:MAG: hypothetical protein OEV94_05360 [Deltaproteobacteria bacterium]|nr:hypothetical protein [Deltaproteobacteria bacterium]